MNEGEEKLVALVAERFRRLKQEGFSAMESEEAVKQGAVLPLLRDLGWDVFNTRQVVPEYSCGGGRVDYALLLREKPRVFIEAKGLSSQLRPDDQEQLCSYTSKHGVPLAVLTNGKTWEFYLALTEGRFYERKVFSIEVEHQDPEEAARHMVKLLSKSGVEAGEAEAYAKKLHESHQRDAAIDGALPRAWEKLFRDPDSILVDYLAEEAEAVCGFKPDPERVQAFLRSIEKTVPPPPPLPIRRDRKKKREKTKPDSDTVTGKKPRRVTVLGKVNNVETWRDVLTTTCGIMAERHPREHMEVLLNLKGRSMVYFSRDSRKLRDPLTIPNTHLYAEGNLSADQIMRNCRKILAAFGHKADDFSVDVI